MISYKQLRKYFRLYSITLVIQLVLIVIIFFDQFRIHYKIRKILIEKSDHDHYLLTRVVEYAAFYGLKEFEKRFTKVALFLNF